MNREVFDARLQHPFTMLIAGPSGSGKSTFICSLLANAHCLINTGFDYVVCFLGSPGPQTGGTEAYLWRKDLICKGTARSF